MRILRAARYVVQVSLDGRRWQTVARMSTRRPVILDRFTFRAVRARFARFRVTPAAPRTEPLLQELTLTG